MGLILSFGVGHCRSPGYTAFRGTAAWELGPVHLPDSVEKVRLPHDIHRNAPSIANKMGDLETSLDYRDTRMLRPEDLTVNRPYG